MGLGRKRDAWKYAIPSVIPPRQPAPAWLPVRMTGVVRRTMLRDRLPEFHRGTRGFTREYDGDH